MFRLFHSFLLNYVRAASGGVVKSKKEIIAQSTGKYTYKASVLFFLKF